MLLCRADKDIQRRQVRLADVSIRRSRKGQARAASSALGNGADLRHIVLRRTIALYRDSAAIGAWVIPGGGERR